ncbi:MULTISPECIES: FUSC family protein [unclassified Cupriavidus]|uniref:FUSC family protein n=1 Tax=unclassified Cupriavidus TaxID=2640874 RepID=UPI001C003FA7|nr:MULTISPECIES: FUSC family protein [unclassified Cupriavidus]MCA3189246.1 FUSC family protein [Cupriavidus sp.]MCA3195326.1 FUSC family protein [Cupriavidus sp.]MCA3200881.1 FUSC family protein [Cupriavidus sp.]MCA3233632.1 FUSC family protein [Cupriavidus sp.]QWE95739.1 FUSC family protein [Cupriavidus sp. EM10]
MASWPHARQWLFSLKAFAAAMLALYIALSFGLPRPYWAMATVYFVSNPLTGATRSKAAYRVAGTVLGAMAAVITVPQLVNMPIVLMGAIALWIMALVYLSQLQRSPRSYVFLLAAYTLPIVALPAVMQPADIFDIAVARIEEIVIGIVCASLVGAIVFPAKVAPALRERARVWLDDAAAWARDIGAANPRAVASRHRLAADMLALDQLIVHLSFDIESRQTVDHARALRGRMSRLMPVLSGLESVLQALRDTRAPWLPRAALEQAAALLNTRHALLMRACDDLQQRIADRSDALPATSQKSEIADPEAGDDTLHHDHAMLVFGAVSAGLAVFCAGLLWIFSGWEDGGGPVAVSAIACCFFATIDEPRPVARSFVRWATICLLISSFYLFLVVPHAQTFETLAGMLSIPYLGIGVLIQRPGFNLIAMLLSVNTASFANVQTVYDANFIGLFNTNLANAAAMLFAPLWAMLARPFGAHVAAQRLIRASWQDLARAATWRGADAHTRVGARMLDRLGQLMPRLGASGGRLASDGFTELQIGYCTLALQRALPSLPVAARKPVRRVLGIVARHFRAQIRARHAVQPPPALQDWIATSLTQLAPLHDRALAADVQCALVVLGVTLHSHEKND